VAQFVKGDVVVVPFPFSAFAGDKVRPAIVLAACPFGTNTDYVLCMISTQDAADPNIMPLDVSDVVNGRLNVESFVRPTYLFTVAEMRIRKKIGNLTPGKLASVYEKIKSILS
jgi:mRNA interferase MazF